MAAFTKEIKQLAEAMGKRVMILNNRSSPFGSLGLIQSKANDPDTVVIGTRRNAGVVMMLQATNALSNPNQTCLAATHAVFCGEDYVLVSAGQLEPVRHMFQGPIGDECKLCMQRCITRLPCLNCGVGICTDCADKINQQTGCYKCPVCRFSNVFPTAEIIGNPL